MRKILGLFMALILGISQVSLGFTNPDAKDVTVNTSNFSKNLNSSDSSVQSALNTLDQLISSNPVNWNQIGGIQSSVNVGGFNNNVGYLTSIPTIQGSGINWASVNALINNSAMNWPNIIVPNSSVNWAGLTTINGNGVNWSDFYPTTNPFNYITNNNINWAGLTEINGVGINWASFYPTSNPFSYLTTVPIIQAGGINWASLNASIQSGGINWASLVSQIQASGINWSSLNQNIQTGGINWSSLIKAIQTSGINWQSVINSEMQSAGINWASLNNSVQAGGFNWQSLYSMQIQSSGINWASLVSSIQASGVNWSSLIKTLQTGNINWTSLINSEIQNKGINWASLNSSIQASGINWPSLYSLQIQEAGINWNSLIQNLQSSGINWASLNASIQASGINWNSLINSQILGSGINWQSLVGYSSGYLLTATSNGGVNWQPSPNSMVYPGAGIPNSSGSAWNASYGVNGSGNVVLTTSPTLVSPVLGVALATSLNGLTISTTTGTLSIANSKTGAINNSLTLAGTDSTTMTFPTTSATIARTDASNVFAGHQTIEGVTSTGATGTGNLVFSTAPVLSSPTLTTPSLGSASATSLNISGLTTLSPVLTDVSDNLISGSLSGNTLKLATSNGTLTPGDCVRIDANGNYIDALSPCGVDGPGGVTGSIQVNSLGAFLGYSTFVYTGGNVGIGSQYPGQTLDVQGTIRSLASTIGSLNGILKGTSGAVGTATSGTDYAPATVGSSILYANSGGFGNVGIGTGLAFTGGGLYSTVSGGSPGGTIGQIQYNNAGAFGGISVTGSDGTNIGIGTVTPLASINIQKNGFNDYLRVDSTAQAKGNILLVQNSGNVGIGTINPQSILAVGGGVSIGTDYATQGSPTNGLITEGNVAIGTKTPGGYLTVGSTGGFTVSSNGSIVANSLQTSTLSSVAFSNVNIAPGANFTVTENSVVPFTIASGLNNVANTMYLTSGNVGIGSTNPGTKLDVQGTARVTQLDVEGTLGIIHDTSGGGCTGITTHAGTITGVVVSCP